MVDSDLRISIYTPSYTDTSVTGRDTQGWCLVDEHLQVQGVGGDTRLESLKLLYNMILNKDELSVMFFTCKVVMLIKSSIYCKTVDITHFYWSQAQDSSSCLLMRLTLW